MSATPEPLAAILAEMRRANFQPQFYQRCVNEYAARIEAAAKQEAIDAELKWTRIGYDERKAEEKRAPGNAAALRAALEKFLDFSRRGLAFFTSYRYTEAENAEIEAAFDGAKAALAAPARNCDVSRDTKETIERCLAGLNVESSSASFDAGVCAAIGWLFAPAEGGEK